MDSVTLQCFIAVAETGSFTSAAKKMFRTQSAISQQISKLERSIGKRVFERGTRLELTEAGQLMLIYARKIVALGEEAIEHFRGLDVQGEIRFGLPEDFASVLLSQVLIDFARTHPQVVLNVETDLTLTLLERFKKGEFDLVLVKLPRPEDFPHGVEVWSEELCWVAKRGFLDEWSAGEALPLVLSPAPCVYRDSAVRALEAAETKWRVVFSSPNYAGKIAAVTAGIGVTVLPHSMIPSQLEPVEHPSLPVLDDTHVSLLKQSSEVPAVSSLEEYVIAQLRQADRM